VTDVHTRRKRPVRGLPRKAMGKQRFPTPHQLPIPELTGRRPKTTPRLSIRSAVMVKPLAKRPMTRRLEPLCRFVCHRLSAVAGRTTYTTNVARKPEGDAP
jgi:hypothetical protein